MKQNIKLPDASGAGLFGREHDLNTVTRMLRQPGCRLVTLLGPGGIGKSRLSLSAAARLQADYGDRIYLIPLQPVMASQNLIPVLIEHLGLISSGVEDTAQQLYRYLRQKPTLLVLDNFEHLAEAADAVAAILAETSDVKILVTSREVLNLQQEWVWPVRGITYPALEQIEQAQEFPAIQMFDACARRVNPVFDLERELATVVRICALVEGSPLAIELATGWLKSLTCSDILAELRRDIDILSTRMRDVPEEHRSIRAVFDRSWHLISEQAQRVLMRLSLLRGSFSREAAMSVAGASRALLATLIDKSMLYLNEDGRYQSHELFRQYAYGHLTADGHALAETRNAFARYYRRYLADWVEHVWGERQNEVIQAVMIELQNIRSFSDELTAVDDSNTSRLAIHTLTEVYQFVGYYREAGDFALQVIARLDALGIDQLDDAQKHLLVEMLNNVGWIGIRLGDFEAAEQSIARAVALYDTFAMSPSIGFASDPRISMGELKGIQGDTAAALAFSEAAYTDAISRDDQLNAAAALYILTNVALAQGDYERAEQTIGEAAVRTKQSGNRWFLAYCLNQLGHICREQGDYASAQHHYEESFRIREAFNDPEGQAVALNHLGTLALLQDQHNLAIERFEQSLPIYQRIEDRGGLFIAHEGLAIAYTATGQYETARAHLLQALQIVRVVDVASWTLSLCEAVGEFFMATGAAEYGKDLFCLCLQHSESRSTTQARARRALQGTPQPHDLAASKLKLNNIIAQLEQQLLVHHWDEPAQPALSANAQEGLIEPLSERELEILRLLADGLTNQEIADQLFLVIGTVKSHNYHIFGKLGVKNRSQAVKRARELKLL